MITTPGTGRRKKSHLLTDNTDLENRLVQYYDASDLGVGVNISICGKSIFLYDIRRGAWKRGFRILTFASFSFFRINTGLYIK